MFYQSNYTRVQQKPKYKFKESEGKSKVSKRWHQDIKETINKYNFDLLSVEMDVHCKCDFCGSRMRYSATIKGKLIDSNTPIEAEKNYSVGLDCLEITFGRDWNGFRKAKDEIKLLKEEARKVARTKKNTEKYKDIIEWLNRQHPHFISSNRFLSDMKVILLTGSKDFSPNMEHAIRKMMKRDYSITEYAVKMGHHTEVVRPKLKKIFELIGEMDDYKGSTYGFVADVYRKTEFKVSGPQLEKMESIYKQYLARKVKSAELPSNEELDVGIPF